MTTHNHMTLAKQGQGSSPELFPLKYLTSSLC